MEDAPRTFLIPVRRRWTLWILPTIAFLYFLGVVLLAVFRRRIVGVSMDTLVLAGVGLFVLVALIQLPFFIRRRPKRVKHVEPEPGPDLQDEPPEPRAVVHHDDERLVTSETQQGLRVLEYSAPAKSRNRGAVYSKTYVPVSKEHVLRIEDLSAEPHEL